MDLIKCRECKKNISSNAKTCPNCGTLTEYGDVFKKKIYMVVIFFAAILIGFFVCDQAGLLKHCDYDDEKQGNLCIKKHYSDALYVEDCGSNMYVKNGRCWYKNVQAGFPTKRYYCTEGYLEDQYVLYPRCIVETTYSAHY